MSSKINFPETTHKDRKLQGKKVKSSWYDIKASTMIYEVEGGEEVRVWSPTPVKKKDDKE